MRFRILFEPEGTKYPDADIYTVNSDGSIQSRVAGVSNHDQHNVSYPAFRKAATAYLKIAAQDYARRNSNE